MIAHAAKSESLGRRLAGLCFAVLASAPAVALAVPGNTGAVTVLAEGLNTPTTVAVRNGLAFVPEGQLGRAGILGGVFTVRAISLEGAGILQTVLLPGNDFFPEGIALDPVSNDLFVGSIFQGEIVNIADGATQTLRFADRAPNVLQRGAVGERVDANLGLLWVCDTNFGANIAGGAVVGLDIDDATEVVRHELPAGSFCNDIIIEADGDLLVAETLVGQIFRIDANETLIENSAQLFLQTAELAPPAAGQLGANGLGIVDGVLFVSNTFAGTLVRFDLNAADIAGSVQVVTLREGNNANLVLSGPDGFLPISDTQALVVENGFAGVGRNALVRVDFDQAP
jgi:sugar lactone lactonase YvrE